ncbi:hypothetical protein [Ruegeria meonggei]|uniref:Exostosin family protein n=1 Tax=Ruegeria meonggei TaxID=1446476 RepID=A0A1X6Z126_9RHOB|nr:hypothetical protein [Ruegeria meonggei]SLN37716.1 hypothetical protein RUM8411_01644 [Ruegeria meonggei]
MEAIKALHSTLLGAKRELDSGTKPKERPLRTLPPSLPPCPPEHILLPDSHVLAELPCTRYWHEEKRKDVNGLPAPGVPHWLRRFDWLVGWEHGWVQSGFFPRHVYCHPNAMTGLLSYLKDSFQERNPGSFLVIGGGDTPLSSQSRSTIRGLKKYFRDIYYEAFDRSVLGVKMMPIGLQEFYIRGFEKDLRSAVRAKPQKTRLALSSFGKFWPGLEKTIPDRTSAKEFAASSDFITCGPFAQPEYYEALATHHYMICPLGNGVQAPKIMEAFLFRCIPIMTDSLMARTYAHKGAPVLIVKNWSDLNQELLEKSLPILSDRANSFFDVASDPDKWWEFSFERSPTTDHFQSQRLDAQADEPRTHDH